MKLSKEEQKLNWCAVLESGSMSAVHNLREYIKSLEEENEKLKKTCQMNLEDNIVANRKLNEIKDYLAYDIPHELMNEATNKIWRII